MNDEPLASKFRPATLDQFVGQKHLVGEEGPLRKMIEQQSIPSMIFWGPPGSGKTTLAYIISRDLRYDFYKLQAVSSGKSKLMEIIKISRQNLDYNKKTVLFLDEIHRWNKAQQDTLLPYVEKGVITLIGATTENPSFTINNALLSRTKLFVFNPLSADEIEMKLEDISQSEFGDLIFEKGVLADIAKLADGDMRSAYNILEMGLALSTSEQTNNDQKSVKKVKRETILKAVQKRNIYDRDGEEHYNLMSAVHKSLRSSNPDAAVYWISRMLLGGEDPLYIVRRLIRFSAEDIGNADPQALILSTSVLHACQHLGMPECEVHIVQLAQYLANAPKDNSAYVASSEAKSDAINFGALPVPLHLRNSPTKLMKEQGYGKGYEYDHDLETKRSDQQCMPDKLKNRKYFKLS